MTDQLNLFEFKQSNPPSAEVIPFPGAKRIGKARTVASKLSGKTSKAAESYWRQIIEGMAAQMRNARISEPVILAELKAFSSQVNLEMQRQNQSGKSA